MQITLFTSDIIMNLGVIVFFLLFVFLFFILSTFIISLFMKDRKYKAFMPMLSVIIPAYNEENNLAGCLNSITKSNYDKNKIEIIVVDDNSKDKTREVARGFMKINKNVRLVEGSHKGKSACLNLGVRRSSYNIIVTVDADIKVDRNFLRNIVRPLSVSDVGASNGCAFISSPKKLLESFQHLEYNFFNLIRVSFSRIFRNSIWFFGAAAAFKKEALKSTGYFKNDTLTEDMDICLELFRQGYRITTVSKATYNTLACKTLSGLFKQRMRWYYGALQCVMKHRALIKIRKSSPAVWFLFLNQGWWTIYAFISLPLIVYQVNFWWPAGTALNAFSYLFRWFTLLGPFYVLYKIPGWGLSLLNIFGVSSGIVSAGILLSAIAAFRRKLTFRKIIALFLYFPYTILINLTLVVGIFRYGFSKKRYFIK